MNSTRYSIFAKLLMLCFVYVCGMLYLSHGFALDTYVSDLFFTHPCSLENVRSCWFFDKSNKSLTFLLHDLPVRIVTVFAVLSGIVFGLGFFMPRFLKYRSISFMLLIALALFPGMISLLKHYTGHFCPGQLGYFGGPVGVTKTSMKPRCFPAGFPSPGFGLVILYFSSIPLIWRRAGLWLGLGLGSCFSIIQIARGEHFLSHNIATLLSALFVGGLVYLLNQYFTVRYHAPSYNRR